MTRAPLTLRVDGRYVIAFYCVVMLWASLHELIHHVAGYAVCGAWGYKTFNYFSTACDGTAASYGATFAGPLLTYAAMWLGWWLLARSDSTTPQRHLGFAMIFAQLPAQRLSGPLLGFNDEYYAAKYFFGATATTAWWTLAVIVAITLPPLVGAWRAIANRRRAAWFAFYFLLFPYLVWGPAFTGLEYLLVQRHVWSGTTVGIAHLFIVNEVVTIAGYLAVKRWLAPSR